MSEQEKEQKVLDNIKYAMENMTNLEKARLLGYAQGMAAMARQREEKAWAK